MQAKLGDFVREITWFWNVLFGFLPLNNTWILGLLVFRRRLRFSVAFKLLLEEFILIFVLIWERFCTEGEGLALQKFFVYLFFFLTLR